MARARPGAVGRAFWGLAPYAPAAPFRLYAGQDRGPIDVPDVATLRRAAQRGGDVEAVALTTVKLRPVLVVAEAGDAIDGPAVLALRLRRFTRLDDTAQETVRAGRSARLLWLRPDRFPGLPEENAAMLTDLVRMTRSALDDTEDLGGLDAHELRIVHERIAAYYDLDLGLLARRAIRP